MRALLLGVVLAGVLLAAQAPDARACPAGCFVDVATLGEAPATGQGVFRFPQAIAYTPGGGGIFVADQFGGVVQRFDRSGAWQRDIGYYADGRELGRIGVVGGLATDRNGHVYVLDSENDRVQVFRASDGEWLAAWGSTGQGNGQFRLGDNTGAGGLAIDHPSPGATPVAYVADQYNHRIQAFRLEATASGDPTGPVLPPGARTGDVVAVPTPSAGWASHGNCAPNCAGNSGFYGRLSYPQGIAVDSRADGTGRRHVFVADDRNHRVVEYLPDGTYVNQVGSFGTAAGQFRFPYDVGVDARDPRQLYVADNNNHRIQAFDAASLAFVRGWGAFGPEPGHLEFVRALAALADDPAGGVAVADTANNRVQTFSADGQITAAWGIAGRGPGYVTRPGAVAVDTAGVVHVADTFAHRVERLDRDGAYLGQTGYIASSSGFAAPAAGAGQFESPAGVAFSPATGRIWVADTANDRVQELTTGGAWVATHGGADSGLGQFLAPRAIAVGADGAVLVADTGNARVQRRDPVSGAWSVVSSGGVALSAPAGVAGAADGSVYASDGDRVVHLAGAASSVLPAPAAGALKAPGGLARHGTALYVADTGNSRVLRHNLGTGAWDVFGTEGRGVGQFVAPTGLAVDPAGESLVVADTGNDRLQRFRLGGAAAPQTARLDVTVAGGGSGLVRSDPPGILCPTDCRQGFSRGRPVTLTPVPAAGTAFVGWSGSCSGTGTCQVDPASAGSVTATFSGPAPIPPPVAPPPAPGPSPPPPASAPPPSRPPTTTSPTTAPRPGTASNPRPRDRRAPVLGSLRLAPARIVAARRGPTARIARTGATLRFSLSERARLVLAFDRGRGRRMRRMRGTVRLRSPAGRRTLRISGRHRGRPLPRGRYRLVISAVDAAGNRSPARRVAFRIVRR